MNKIKIINLYQNLVQSKKQNYHNWTKNNTEMKLKKYTMNYIDYMFMNQLRMIDN